MVINNFRQIPLSYDKQPPYLNLVETYKGFEIYHSSFNPLLLVVKNPEDQKYYPFEDTGESTDYLVDIKACINSLWIND